MKRLASLISSVLFLAGVAVAQQTTFEELDSDADGTLSKTEVQSVDTIDFDNADVDQDGSLSQEEYEAVMEDE